MRIFASRDDDIGEGFVWLQVSGLPSRSVVRIESPTTRHTVYCEALQIDANFLRLYNQPGRCTIEDPANSIVMSAWYRQGLGCLDTRSDYPLRIVSRTSFAAKIRMCLGHPQTIVRVAASLGLWSVFLGGIGVALGLLSLWPRSRCW